MTLKLAAGMLALAGLGAAGGAAIYASIAPGTTTTVVTGSATPDTPISQTKNLSANEIYRLTSPGIVELRVVQIESNPYVGDGSPQPVKGEGTGFVYNRLGNIVTNDHVAGGAKSITVRFSDNQTFKAHVVGRDTDSDIAVIKISAPTSLLHPLTLGDSTKARVGDAVVAIGSPFGHAESLSAGVVSGLHVPMSSPSDVPTDSIQTDAAINPGSSGGVLLNGSAEVIGITTSTQSRNGYSNGVGFVIPSNIVRSVARVLVTGHKVNHAYFGASMQDATTPLGAKLVTVLSAGPSAHSGLRKGDVITSLNGIAVASADDMISLTKAHLAGETVSVAYTRGGKSHTVQVALGKRPA